MTAPAPGVMPVFIDVTVPNGEPGPGFSEIMGRPVAFVVKQVGQSAAFDKTDSRADANGNIPTVWYDIYIGGTGLLTYGAAPKANPPRPFPTHQVQTPAVFRNQMSSHELIYRALAPHVGQPNFVTGVIAQIGRAYCINKFGPTDGAIAGQLQADVTALVTGAMAEAVPVPLNFAAPQAQPQAAATPVQQYAPQPVAQPVQAVAPAPAAQAGVQNPGTVPDALWATLSEQQRQMLAAQAAPPAQPPMPY